MTAGAGWRLALALGMIGSMSSTAIVLGTLSDRGMLKTAGGQSAFSILLFGVDALGALGVRAATGQRRALVGATTSAASSRIRQRLRDDRAGYFARAGCALRARRHLHRQRLQHITAAMASEPRCVAHHSFSFMRLTIRRALT